MRRGTDAGTGIIELVGVRFGARNQLLNRIDAESGIGHDHIRRSPELCDRREIFDGVVGNFRIQAWIDDVGARRDQERVAVRLGVGRGTDPDIAAGSRPVLDDDTAAQGMAEMLAENARHDVGRSGRRERHDDLDGAAGIVRRPRPGRSEAGHRRRGRNKTGGPQNLAARGQCAVTPGQDIPHIPPGVFLRPASSGLCRAYSIRSGACTQKSA
jgi:hypothetical protein